MDFDEKLETARSAMNKATSNFDQDDLERYCAFAFVCLSEAARRYVVSEFEKPQELFAALLDYWATEPECDQTEAPTFHVIEGGKSPKRS